MKYCIVILLQFALLISHSQNDPVFRVALRKDIRMVPDLDTVIAGKTYNFIITAIKIQQIYEARFTGGTATITDSGITLQVGKSPPAKNQLQLFCKKDKYLQVVFEKKIVVLPALKASIYAPPPVGWPSNSVGISIGHIVLGKTKYIFRKNIPVNNEPMYAMSMIDGGEAISFKLSIEHNGKTENFPSRQGYFTDDMINALGKASNGDKVTFSDIKYQLAHTSGDLKIAGPFTLEVRN